LGRVPVHFGDATIVLGPHGRAELRSRDAGATVYEIPQPVDWDRFSPVPARRRAAIRTELGMPPPDGGRALLTVGRLSRRKGLHHVARAARDLAARGADCRWYILGDGPMRERLAAAPLVEVVGRVPHGRMPDYYRAADLLVHPSLIEGLPNVLLEATACGLPSLARDVGECATVASRTYDDPSALPDLVSREYDRSTLGDRFDPDRLREAYVEAVVETAGLGRS
jgi:glycosyltransferase involved in cell wall biosynthesis